MGITGVVIWFTGATAHLLSSPVPPSRAMYLLVLMLPQLSDM